MRLLSASTLALILLAPLAGCTGMTKPEHHSQSAPGVNIGAYSSFGWKSPGDTASGDEPMRILDVSIQNAIRAELTKRGYLETAENPQLLVTFDTAAQEKVKSNPISIGFGVGSWGGSGGGSVGVSSSGVSSYKEGRLSIHMIDTAGSKEVWVGSVSGQVDQADLSSEAVARVVATAMQDFPLRAMTP